jgi:biotin synthase
MESSIRHNWTKEEIKAIYNTPLIELLYKAASTHREYHNPREVQVSSLLSIKTGGCTEDCSYCSQSARYNTGLKVQKLMDVKEVVESAKNAKAGGASRFCMGAAWREVRDNRDFDRILEMVREVSSMDMEVCCTLGMLTESQAKRLEEAGLYAYNHKIDTSEENYNNVITTRTYEDRLKTVNNIRKTKVTVCSGGIIGLGEKEEDRISMLYTLSNLTPHPESVPINALVPIDGTPLEVQSVVSTWDMVRMIATARIVLPKSDVRLSAGRTEMNMEAQALCFMAGANSIFAGDKLLTTPNPDFDQDKMMFDLLGLVPRPAYAKQTAEAACC